MIITKYLDKLKENSEEYMLNMMKEKEIVDCNPYEINFGYTFVCILLFFILVMTICKKIR